jgi:putative oxidoreductase
MDIILKLNRWANAHTNYGIDALRVILGAFLIYKGIFFMGSNYADNMVDSGGSYLFLIHYIAMAHLAGGVLIAIGLITRYSALVQVPILIGALVVNFTGSFNMSNFVQAFVALVLSVFFVIYGSGKHSVDHQLRMHK